MNGLRLRDAMAEAGWSALRLAAESGVSSKRSINRWLDLAAGSVDGYVTVRRSHAEVIADALGLPLDHLVDPATPDGESTLARIAAALGPRIHTRLMERLAPGRGAARLAAGPGFIDQRFERWSVWERLIREGATLSIAQADRAMAIARELELTPEHASELHTMCAIYRDRTGEALDHGRRWMDEAERAGRLQEVAWLGRRLLRLDGAWGSSRLALTTQIALDAAAALLLVGEMDAALEVLSDVSLACRPVQDPLVAARISNLHCRIRLGNGQIHAAIEAASEAAAQLDGVAGEEASSLLATAIMDKIHALELLNRHEGARSPILTLYSKRRRSFARAASVSCAASKQWWPRSSRMPSATYTRVWISP